METSEIIFIDTHCHLYASDFDTDRHTMIERAMEAGVKQMMLPNIDIDSIDAMWKLVDQFPVHCFPMMGLHPCSVREDYQSILSIMKENLKMNDYVGIGETGIDLYWDTTHKDLQIDAFEQQISWAKEMDLPVVIHSRESLDLNIEIISSHQDGRLKGIFHCFGGTYVQAKRIHELGFKIGIGGVITYKNSGLDAVLPLVPVEMVVLETDAPYLAPVPYRGKRNESAYLKLIAEKLANYLCKSLEDVAIQTTLNASTIFRKKG